MNCRSAQKWIDAAFDEPRPAANPGLEAHLAACEVCRTEWRRLESAEAALRLPQPVEAPHGMLAEFRRRLAAEDAHQEVSRAPRWSWWWPGVSVGAAGAMAALVLGLRLYPYGGISGAPHAPARAFQPAPASAQGGAPFDTMAKGVAVPGAPPGGPAGALEGGTSDRMETVRPGPLPDFRRAGAPPAVAREDPRQEATSPVPAAVPGLQPPVSGKANGAGATPALEEARRADFDTQRRAARMRGGQPAAAPLAEALTVQEAQADLLPPEFNVSSALLTALQRPVRLRAEGAPVREVLARLTESADVVLNVDPGVAPLRVTVRKEGEPLWVVLQSVAQQGRLRIEPEENHLVLRAVSREVGEKKKDALVAGRGVRAPEPAAPPAPAPPAGPATLGARPLAATVVPPDRAVWGAAWGSLPERGFEPPRPEDLPPAVASLPQMMGEGAGRQKLPANGQQPYFRYGAPQGSPGKAAKPK